jgi:hypothetical protein
MAVAVLANGMVVTGGNDRRVLAWDPARTSTPIFELNCPVTTLAAASLDPSASSLVIAHTSGGVSLWSFTG